MSSLQKSVWSSDLPSGIDHHQSSMKSYVGQWNIGLKANEMSERRRRYFNKIGATTGSCIRCFIIGLLLAGIPLAVIMTLWLAPSATTISSTTTSVTTTTTTPTPPCPPISVGSSSIIYSATSANQNSYECHAFLWTSNITGSITLTFQLQNRPYYWLLDDISAHNGAVEMLINRGFETGFLSPWVRTDPFGPCGGSDGQVKNISSYTGIYHLLDGSDICPDRISQTFSVTNGQIYTISFGIRALGSGPGISIDVTLS